MSDSDDHYLGILLEDIQHRLQLVQEALEPLKNVPSDIKELKEQMILSNERHDLAEFIMKDYSKTLNNHDRRITTLETA